MDDWKNIEAHAYVLVYSIDSKSSFRTVTNVMEDLRAERNNAPIILAGNKVDLERKRAVAASEVRAMSHQYNVANFEISVALNHEVFFKFYENVTECEFCYRSMNSLLGLLPN